MELLVFWLHLVLQELSLTFLATHVQLVALLVWHALVLLPVFRVSPDTIFKEPSVKALAWMVRLLLTSSVLPVLHHATHVLEPLQHVSLVYKPQGYLYIYLPIYV